MKDLISEQDIINAANLHKYRLDIAAKALMKIFGLDKVNEFYKQISEKTGFEFIEAVFQQLNITIDVPENDLNHIPEKGKFIVVCNHPFGALDGLILMHIIG
ncbi:MAG: GNAT family N-acetyltransferase, partial [Luteibaculum sp.]